MKINSSKFVSSAATFGQCLVSNLCEIAVVGKSNVGKSSFINYLTNDGKLARTSKTPGRTRLINYFLLNEQREDEFLLTDLPGYGYAQVSFSEKQKWAELIDAYLNKSQSLKHVLFLVDIRHEPSVQDKTMFNFLFKNSLPFSVIATKADKLSKSQQHKAMQQIATTFKLGLGNIIAVSSTNKTGKEQVLAKIEQILETHASQQQQDEQLIPDSHCANDDFGV